MSNVITDYWNQQCPIFIKIYHRRIDEELSLIKRIYSEMFLKDKKLNVLDIRVGRVILALIFAELGYNVTAIGITEEMLSCATKSTEIRNLSIKFIGSNGQGMPFDDNYLARGVKA